MFPVPIISSLGPSKLEWPADDITVPNKHCRQCIWGSFMFILRLSYHTLRPPACDVELEFQIDTRDYNDNRKITAIIICWFTTVPGMKL